MTDTSTATNTRGRKPLTFDEIIAREPHEVDVAFAEFLTTVLGTPTDAKSVRLLSMPSVRNMFHNSDLYKNAERKRQERIDAAKLASVNVSIDAMLAKLSPEQLVALAAKLNS